MSPARRAPALILAVLLSPSLALAAWQPGGNRIGDGDGFGFVAAASGERVVVAWQRRVPSGPFGRYEVRLQAWTADGDLAEGWPPTGVLVGDRPGSNHSPAVCEDGAGGAFVVWVNELGPDRSLWLQHVSATGSLSPGWSAEGRLLGAVPVYTWTPVAAHDGAGGVLVGWTEYYYDGASHTSVRIHRIDAGGAPAAGWPVEGHSIPNSYEVSLVADGEQHVFVSTGEYSAEARLSRLRVQRLAADATPDPGWPQAGALLTEAVAPIQMRLFPDGSGGVFTGWVEAVICVDFCPEGPGSSATRILGDGTRDEGWIPAFRAYSAAPDETGGMMFGLVSGGRPSAVRLDAAGRPMPGWAREGNAAMTETVQVHDVRVAGDGKGGAFVTWSDWRTGRYRLYASRLDAAGRLANGWPATGSFVDADRGGYASVVGLVSLGGGVAIAAWTEWTPEGPEGYLTALHPGEPGPIAGLGPVPVEVGFGVTHVRPNPAHGPIVAIVELPNEGPARIDLVDAAGRVHESQDFSFMWQARGAVRFNQTRALPPGVYWLRLTQGARVASKKLVVLE